MESDPDKINDAARLHVEKIVYTEGEFYAASNKRQKKENELRAKSRDRIKESGLRPDAYALAVKLVRNSSPKDRKIFLEDLQVVLDVLGKAQAELFPEDLMKQQKKEAREKAAAEEAARVAAENAATDPDKKPKSDPKRGGAGGVNGRGKAKDKAEDIPLVPGEEKQETGDEMIKRVAAEKQAELEQREGGTVLDGHFPKNGSPRKSQSAQAAEILEKNGLNKPLH